MLSAAKEKGRPSTGGVSPFLVLEWEDYPLARAAEAVVVKEEEGWAGPPLTPSFLVFPAATAKEGWGHPLLVPSFPASRHGLCR